MTRFRILAAMVIIGFCAGFTNSTAGTDPGTPDTVKLEGGPLVVGQSVPLSLTIVNDSVIGCYSLGFVLNSALGGGFATFDSVVYINRMSDPRVMSYRVAQYEGESGIPPDSFFISALSYTEYDLPPGNDAIGLYYFTGTSAGTMSIDSAYFPPAGYFLLCDKWGGAYTPQCVSPDVEVIEGNPPPQINIYGSNPPVACGNTVDFYVGYGSPVEFPVTLEVVDLVGYDDESVLPANSPNLSSGNPATFTWNTTCDDIGIWLATVEACDSSGTCATAQIDIQVVENASFLLSFSTTANNDVFRATALKHGNMDNDSYLELVGSGSGAIRDRPELVIYNCSGNEYLSEVFGEVDGSPCFNLQLGYLDGDGYLDAVMMRFNPSGANYHPTTFFGNGSNSFDDTLMSADFHGRGWGSVLGEFTGDGYLDYVTVMSRAEIMAGNGAGNFTDAISVNLGSDILSVNGADFDGDGYDDLTMGTADGIYICLNDGNGGFTQDYFYSQSYGSVEIEVTNQGSDFNDDNIFDLCISTPSLGGEYSEMMVYLGAGDGSFTQHSIRTVRGQIFGNGVGDFNNDGELDIAFVNGALDYAAILFGDGDGQFTNELRFHIAHDNPCQIDNYDVDLDGDVDLIVAANGSDGHNSLFYLSNQLDPSGFTQTNFHISACDNAVIELTSATGKVFNRIKSSMPSAKCFRRDINENGTLDEYATLGVVEAGEYILTASPRPDLPVGSLFSVEYTLNGVPYRLARNVSMTESGYDFGICVGGDCTVMPRSGTFIHSNPPTFTWSGTGPFEFQLASDIDFSNLIVDVTVEDNMHSPTSAVEVTDTTLYYWRVKPQSSPEYACLYAVNIVNTSAGAGDANGDGSINVADAVFIVNYVFRGGSAPDPLEAGDANCDGAVNIGDAVFLISYIFLGGPAPNCP